MIDDLTKDEQVQQFWDAYAISARVSAKTFAVLRFGDGADLADELAAQAVRGTKRAMTSLLRDFTKFGKPLPKFGDLFVVIDGKNSPRCIVSILRVDIKPLRDVDEGFAWDAGGGDRSLAWWQSAHERYFKRRGDRDGFEVDNGTDVVLARFAVVWPQEEVCLSTK